MIPLPIKLMLVVFLVPPELTISLGSIVLPPMRLYCLLIAPWAIANLFSFKQSMLCQVSLALMGLLTVQSFLALITHHPPAAAIQAWGSLVLETVVPFAAGVSVVPRKGRAVARKILVMWATIMAVFGLVTIIGALFHFHPFRDPLRMVMGQGVYPRDVRMGMVRMIGPFDHEIHYGLLTGSSIVFAYYLFRSHMSRIPGVLGVCLAAFSSLSSGAILSLMFQWGLIAVDWIKTRARLGWAPFFACVVVMYILIDLLSNRTPMRVFFTYATFNPQTAYMRMEIYNAGMENVRANPLLGLGLGDWVRPAWMHSSSVDNYWLLITMRYGVPYFLFSAALAVIAIYSVGSGGPAKGGTPLNRALCFSLVTLVIGAVTVHLWGASLGWFFFIQGLAISMAASPSTAGRRGAAKAGKKRRRRRATAPGVANTRTPGLTAGRGES